MPAKIYISKNKNHFEENGAENNNQENNNQENNNQENDNFNIQDAIEELQILLTLIPEAEERERLYNNVNYINENYINDDDYDYPVDEYLFPTIDELKYMIKSKQSKIYAARAKLSTNDSYGYITNKDDEHFY
jgi:hypothetical protein